jgi:hypothetical protein
MEVEMSFVTGEVVEDLGGEAPFKVVFKQGDEVLAEWSVESKEEGEEQIVAAVRSLMEEHGEEDEEEGEDGEEGDDEGDEEEDDDKPRGGSTATRRR